jgi:excinuclease UvrABC ATPase subunit
VDDADDVREVCRRRLARRAKTDPDKRETLVPCPACEGNGQYLIRQNDTRYTVIACPWCDGKGYTDQFMISMYRQYERNGLL